MNSGCSILRQGPARGLYGVLAFTVNLEQQPKVLSSIAADHVHKIRSMNHSKWFGIILDTGSYKTGDPYQQIADTAKYAINWHLKENVFINGVEEPANLDMIISAIKASGYRGYLPIETLGAGDPKIKVPAFVEKVRKALG